MSFAIGKWVRRAGLALAGLFVLIQVRPVERPNPPVSMEIDAPPAIAEILHRSCFDCHSHQTRWPWYSRIAPVSWWVADHVEHGRGDLNFSDWPALDFEAQEHAFRDIEQQIVGGEMPLRSYLILHPEARLDEAERRALIDWARAGY